MDYARGTVGESPRISWQALSEWCRQESRQGVPEEKLNRWQLDRLIGHLERAGLVRRRPIRSPQDPIVFRLPLADRDSHVQKNPAHDHAQDRAPNPARAPHRETPANPAHEDAPNPAPNPAHHPGSGFPMVTSSSSTTIDEGTAAGDDDDGLILPSSLTPAQAAGARRRVRGMNGSAQTVLDELHGYLAAAHGKGDPIRSPLRYLDRIIESAREPGWQPVHAPEIAFKRQRLMQAARNAPAPAKPGLPGDRGDPDIARKAIEAMKSTTRKGKACP